MSDFPFAIVGFDLDGTFLDTSGDLTAAVNDTLTFAGRPLLDIAQVKTMIGGGAKHMLALGLEATGGCTPEDFRPLYKRMLGYYEAHVAVHSAPYPGALETLERLGALGVRTGIVTNKFESLARKLLGELGLLDRFGCVIGGDTMSRIMGGKGFSKPHPAGIEEMIRQLGGGRAAFVGDSIYDMMAARNAGVPAIAASFGFLLEPVEEMGADAVIDSWVELIPVLEGLGS